MHVWDTTKQSTLQAVHCLDDARVQLASRIKPNTFQEWEKRVFIKVPSNGCKVMTVSALMGQCCRLNRRVLPRPPVQMHNLFTYNVQIGAGLQWEFY